MKVSIASIFKSKTMLFAVLLAVMGVVQASLGVFSGLMSAEAYGLLGVAVGAIVAGLRIITVQPLNEK